MARWTKNWDERCHVEDLEAAVSQLIGHTAIVLLRDGSSLMGVLESRHHERRVVEGAEQQFGNLTIRTAPGDHSYWDYLEIERVTLIDFSN